MAANQSDWALAAAALLVHAAAIDGHVSDAERDRFAEICFRFFYGLLGRERIDRVLRSLKREELSDLRDTSGRVVVKCEFCSTEYAYDDGDLDRIYASAA